jgi:hypothetical protein
MSHKHKSKNSSYYDDYDEDDEYGERKTGKKKQSPRRRPVRNWKKAWNTVDGEEEIDDMNR